MRKNLLSFLYLLVFFFLLNPSYSHVIVGETTPIMNRMSRLLNLLESRQYELAFKDIKGLNEDASDDDTTPYLDEYCGTLAKLDSVFGTNLEKSLHESVEKKDAAALKRILYTTGVLLMIDRFRLIQETVDNKEYSSHNRKEIFQDGRNYFSLLLEPTLSKYDPVEAVRMDRLLNGMLYGIEDAEWDSYHRNQVILINRIENYFGLKLPASLLKD